MAEMEEDGECWRNRPHGQYVPNELVFTTSF
jgi:hypothetical protein